MYHKSNSTRRFIKIDRGSLAPKTVNLGPAGQSRFDVMSKCIVRDEITIFGIMGRSVRPRADEGHIAAYHIPQLRKLIDTGSSQ